MLKFVSLSVVAMLQAMLPFVVFADSSSVTIPLQAVSVDQAGNNKLGITVSVAGGPPSLVTFDTGGTGLHIMQTQVPSVQPSPNSQYSSIDFGNGLVYSGYLATVPVTIDNPDGAAVASTTPMQVMIIQKVSCDSAHPQCGAPKSGQPVDGMFWGEFGAGMNPETLIIQGTTQTTTICSPLRYLPGNLSTGYMIENLTPSNDSQGAQGQLIIGLPTQIPVGYQSASLPTMSNTSCPGLSGPIYNDRGLRLTYQIGNGTQTYPPQILPTLFDTGGGSYVSYFTNNSQGYPIQGGGTYGLLEPDYLFSAQSSVFNWSFTTGSEFNLNAVEVLAPSNSVALVGDYVNTGITFFFNYNVIFDFANGSLSFAPNPYAQAQ